MKKLFLFIALFSAMTLSAKPRIDRAEPLCWWTEMNCPLTLLLHGEDLADAQVTIQQLQNGKVVKGECTGLHKVSQIGTTKKRFTGLNEYRKPIILCATKPKTYLHVCTITAQFLQSRNLTKRLWST